MYILPTEKFYNFRCGIILNRNRPNVLPHRFGQMFTTRTSTGGLRIVNTCPDSTFPGSVKPPQSHKSLAIDGHGQALRCHSHLLCRAPPMEASRRCRPASRWWPSSSRNSWLRCAGGVWSERRGWRVCCPPRWPGWWPGRRPLPATWATPCSPGTSSLRAHPTFRLRLRWPSHRHLVPHWSGWAAKCHRRSSSYHWPQWGLLTTIWSMAAWHPDVPTPPCRRIAHSLRLDLIRTVGDMNKLMILCGRNVGHLIKWLQRENWAR